MIICESCPVSKQRTGHAARALLVVCSAGAELSHGTAHNVAGSSRSGLLVGLTWLAGG
jgi:hypothetical protein